MTSSLMCDDNMSDNGIGDNGIRAVAEALKTNSTLKSLYLSCENDAVLTFVYSSLARGR